MSVAADKARFYLEQSVPELQELVRKDVFTKVTAGATFPFEEEGGVNIHEDEISSITKRRTDFEHKLNAAGSRPADYAQYAEYEMNLETLRRKRVRRLGVKVNGFVGRRRIFFILDRATRKFHGDAGLWMQYADYARKEKTHRKFLQITTNALRLLPNRPDLWIYVAKYAMDEQGDMTGARTYLQRGLRFCEGSKELWLAYARLEMIYIAKIEGRRRILGLDHDPADQGATPTEMADNDTIALPVVTLGELNPGATEVDETRVMALRGLGSSPALAGAIPEAVFDAAMKPFPGDGSFAERFFDMFSEFPTLSCARTLVEHVVHHLRTISPMSSSSLSCYIRQPVIGADPASAEFAVGLKTAFGRLRRSFEGTSVSAELAAISIRWLLSLLDIDHLDPGIRNALRLTLKQTVKRFKEGVEHGNQWSVDGMAKLSHSIEQAGYPDEAALLQPNGPSKW